MNAELLSKIQNMEQISPKKRYDIIKMIEVCFKDKNIKKVIIFGSSVTDNCKYESDIDIYYEFEIKPYKYPSTGSNTSVFDKWDNFNVDDNLKNEILNTGVVVYES